MSGAQAAEDVAMSACGGESRDVTDRVQDLAEQLRSHRVASIEQAAARRWREAQLVSLLESARTALGAMAGEIEQLTEARHDHSPQAVRLLEQQLRQERAKARAALAGQRQAEDRLARAQARLDTILNGRYLRTKRALMRMIGR